MIKRGVLMPWLAFSYRHGDAELAETEQALHGAMKVCAKAVQEGFADLLEGDRVIKPVPTIQSDLPRPHHHAANKKSHYFNRRCGPTRAGFRSGDCQSGRTLRSCGHRLERARAAADLLNAQVPEQRVSADVVDMTSRESLNALINRTVTLQGRIDAVVNNAYPRNKQYGRKLDDVEYADFCENVSLHLGGYFLSTQQFAFKQQGFGHVVNVSSIYGVIAPRFEIYDNTPMTMPVEYAAIKAALQHLSVYFMRYYKGHDVRFNCLVPGGIYDRQPEAFLQLQGLRADQGHAGSERHVRPARLSPLGSLQICERPEPHR